jgi:hypothetical protein
MTEAERIDTNHPNLCTSLRWKEMCYESEKDPTLPPNEPSGFWCVYTQSCFGPDGKLAEPQYCVTTERCCHCSQITVA